MQTLAAPSSPGHSVTGSSMAPALVLILSGKRKSGKDFVASILQERINDKLFLRISEPIKKSFTELHGLDFNESLTDSQYKESFRQQMIQWSEKVRKDDPNIFLKQAIKDADAFNKCKVWILVDARRPCDIEYFVNDQQFAKSTIVTIRITADDAVRRNRGFVFTPGVDDVDSECALDHWNQWTYVIDNNNKEELLSQLQPIIDSANATS